MIHRMSKMIADFLFNLKEIDEEDEEVYVYGYESIISVIIDLGLCLSLGCIFHKLIKVLIFFIMFVTVRMYTGGYHADTYLKCKLTFTVILLFILGISEVKMPLYLIIMIATLFLVTVYHLSPVENKNKLLTLSEKKKYRKISIVYSCIWSITAIISYFLKINISSTIAGTMFVITLLMFYGEYRKGK